MKKTYKCKNGHKFKADESDTVKCSSCNEPAELMKWNAVEEFSSTSQGLGFIDEMKSVANVVKGKK